MPDYRVYLIGADGHISQRIELECPDDPTAKETAKRLVDGLDVELWKGERRIETFRHRE